MSYPYHLRSEIASIARLDDPDFTEPEATSSIAAPSSPGFLDSDDFPDTANTPFGRLDPDFFLDEDEGDREFRPRGKAAPWFTNVDKTLAILDFFKTFSRFSLRTFLETLLSAEDTRIHTVVGIFLENGGALAMIKLLWDRERHGQRGAELVEWVVERAGEQCARELSLLTDRASQGPCYNEALALRITSDRVPVSLVQEFSIPRLLAQYEQLLPLFQTILKMAIGKSGQPHTEGMRNPDDGRTMATSIILNLRSRITNYHAAVNAMVLWEQQASKKLVQLLNRTGVCTSYEFQGRAVLSLSKNAVERARKAAADPSTLKMFSYDNFNWRSRAWETSALHGNIQHDQVSAMLIVLQTPSTLDHVTAEHLASVARFAASMGNRHNLTPERSLEDIMPSSQDRVAFSQAIEFHIANVLARDIKAFARFLDTIPATKDPFAIDPRKTERHFLPTFDQEQGSTRGNMVVLSHYFLKVLRLPREIFERVMFFISGDRLTTARDRAAQDQRAVDRSPFSIDHLSSFAMGSGLMHQCLNMIINIARNFWGGAVHDSISLSTLCGLLPNRTDINLHKVDFYAWLRFLDVVLRALTVTAACVTLGVQNMNDMANVVHKYTPADFGQLCWKISNSFVRPSVNRLESRGVKTMAGDTQCGHGIQLLHSLMTLREMRHAIKHGHPGRVHRMLKYWTPMFYAGGSYNYAHEDMELLHNLAHDWPSDSANVVLAGLLVNTTGLPDGFLESDLDIEHLNKNIKGRAHGSNASPSLLEKVTPALGEAQSLTRQMCKDLGIEDLNQRHAEVRQQKDVEILVQHFLRHNLFNFAKDQGSKHTVVDLYYRGLQQLAGPNGGHKKHLIRHQLRLRKRHSIEGSTNMLDLPNTEDVQAAERELLEARDSIPADYTIAEAGSHDADRWEELLINNEPLDNDY